MNQGGEREADAAIDPVFLARWSPRAFDGSALSDGEIARLFEAARWAPSAFNAQPWRFLYARRDRPEWERFVAGLVEVNQSWARNASLLIYALSDSLSDRPDGAPRPSRTHSFDAGAAWMALALQATRMGLHAHGMAGVDYDRVRADLGVPERFRIEAAIAVGRQADKSILPEALRAREVQSGRKPVSEFAFEGPFPA